MFPADTITRILSDKPALTYREACGVAARRGAAIRALRADRDRRAREAREAKRHEHHWWQD